MNIIHIYNTSFPPANSAGAERIAYTLINAQKEIGHNVYHVRSTEQLCKKDIEETEIFHFHSAPDILDSELPEIENRSIITQHGFHWEKEPGFDKMVANADKIVYLSEPHREYHKGIYVVYNFVNCKDYEYNTEKHAGYYAMLLGLDWGENKSLFTMLDIAERTGIKLKIAGWGTNNDILNKVKGYENRNKNIKLMGWLNGKEKNDFMKNARAILVLPHFDAGSLLYIEALATATPIITWSRKAYNMIPSEEYLIRPGMEESDVAILCDSVQDLTRALVTGIVDKIDREKCRALAEEKFDAFSGTQRYQSVYNDILKRGDCY